MDGYEPAYVAHNLPLLVISGLRPSNEEEKRQEDGGVTITSDIPSIESTDAQALLKHFLDSDAGSLPWNSREHSRRNKFRNYLLPARRAQLPIGLERSSKSPGIAQSPMPILHSPLSPLTPSSPLFPDGLMDSRWVEKHQECIPSAYILFYTITTDSTVSTLSDNQLKTDINHIKNKLNGSGYKSRLIVGLLSEKPLSQSLDIEERLNNIRKATGLDSKTSLFFLPSQSSSVEIQAFVETIMSAIYPLCIEYYRELSKRFRKKRSRTTIPSPTVPPTTGTSKTLSSQGWNVRYDFKSGVFAEFRQEMDAAVRFYESGYDILLGEDVLETIANWSPRWNEARVLADIFALRIIRCLLWNGAFSNAVRQWQLHRHRIRDFVDRRGRGSKTYGWEAWEARWATIMGELIKKTEVAESANLIYLPADKSITIGERMQPWEYLHHAGYWFRSASKHLMTRRALALEIPEEDRLPPGSSPASQIANKAFSYDTYLCPEPHEEYPLPGRKGINHSLLIIQVLSKAIPEFGKRGHYRLLQELHLQLANEYIRCEDWDNALSILRPLWQKMTYRREGWWNVVEEIGWALRNVAARMGDGSTVIAVDWELLNKTFTRHSAWRYDLLSCLAGLDTIKAKPAVVLHDQDVHSFLSATYTFEHSEGEAGELCSSQLAVTSSALASSVPVIISEIRILFEGSMKPIILRHNQETEAKYITSKGISYCKMELTDGATLVGKLSSDTRSTLQGESNLTFWPGQTRVFEFDIRLREAGEAKAVSSTFSIASDLFDLEYIQTFGNTNPVDIWWGEQSQKKKIVRINAASIIILPKPPKVELRIVSGPEQYYTNEKINMQLEVINGEEVDSIVFLDAHFLGPDPPSLALRLGSTSIVEGAMEKTSGLDLGRITSADSLTVDISISRVELPAIYEMAIKAAYHLVSDVETPISRSISVQISIINPFEASYDFSPLIHPDPWPSIFNHEEESDATLGQMDNKANGLAQKWCLTTRYASFATEELIVENLEIGVLGLNGNIQCSSQKATVTTNGGVRVRPKIIEEAQFNVVTQKVSLNDRGTATLDVCLAIRWRRDQEGSEINTATLPVPRLLVSSSEPRVLGAASFSSIISSLVHFDVTIENPSNHFLTFGLTMEPSEQFAFSGIRQSTLQLVPLSRRTVRFILLPLVRGWIGIHCVIRDRYFQKILKIAPTEGMKIDKDGLFIWVPPQDEDQ
ncbi:hypothetical protein B7494_g2219 [Chlorociboria aeruginascens]|nr:hypothetical protein B7494_g2219 [Chlorociboria aeruginascens]